MKHPFNCQTETLILADQHLRYRLYSRNDLPQRRLVLVHGAGVAGRDTWEMLLAFLQHWSQILVIDQRGAGESVYPDGQEHPFTLQMLVADLHALVNHLGWDHFDLGGYSLGGLVSMLYKQQQHDRVGKQFLLESALLDRICMEETILLREKYSEAAQLLRSEDVDTGVRQFLDTISPNRKTTEQADQTAISRLAYRPLGFAYALDAVSQGIRTLDRKALIAAQGDVSSFIGGQSVELMHQLHADLASTLPNWHYFLVQGTDHSLPFQKPRQIARLMNQEMQRFLTI
ncbi:MAG: alpha/beta hydrolase [Oceanospirillales bacterium]|nr:MAG: alpha/beta hydrolase [Oceanospirillales bacterium]